MQHLDEGTIHAWLDGALSADEAARVELHVASCETCSDAVAEARGLIAASSRILTALDDVPRVSSAPSGRRDRGGRGWFPVTSRIAAVIALVVAGGALALAVRSSSTPFVALEAKADRENAVTLAALDSPVAEIAAPSLPPNANRPALLRGDGASGRGAAGAVAGRTPTQATPLEIDMAAPSPDSAPVHVAQVEVQAAAPPPAAPPARTDDTARAPSVVAAARVTADTTAVTGRSSVTEKVAGVLGARRSVADASARFAEPAAAQARPLAAPEPGAPRLLTEERLTEANGGVVVRRVYRVEETLVTLDERTPREQFDAFEQRRSREEQQAPVDSTVALERRRRMNLLELEQRRADVDSASTPATTSISWVGASGTEFTLSGAVPREQLERFRRLLGY
jgi:hypothetical protein